MEMPSVVSFDPYSPRINLDSKRVIAYHSSIVGLKEQINKILREPVDNRISLLKPGVCVCLRKVVCVGYLYCSVIACKCMHRALTLKCFTDLVKPVPGEGETSETQKSERKKCETQKNKIGKNLI